MLLKHVRTRVAVALFAWSLVTAAAFAVATFFAADEMEIIVLEQNLQATAGAIRQQLQAGQEPDFPSESWFYGGLESRMLLPRSLRELPAGSFNDFSLNGGDFHIWIEPINGDRLFLIYDLSVIEHYEDRLVVFLMSAVFLLAVLALVTGLLGTGWVLRSLQDLSTRVRSLAATASGFQPPQAQDPDLQDVVKAIDDLCDRNAGLVERERSFTRIASHELRNPLASLAAALDLIAIKPLDDVQQPALQRARRASQRIADMVKTLLQFARER